MKLCWWRKKNGCSAVCMYVPVSLEMQWKERRKQNGRSGNSFCRCKDFDVVCYFQFGLGKKAKRITLFTCRLFYCDIQYLEDSQIKPHQTSHI